jgi:hypothetical protein
MGERRVRPLIGLVGSAEIVAGVATCTPGSSSHSPSAWQPDEGLPAMHERQHP